MYWVGFPLAIGLSLLVVPAGARGLRDAGLVHVRRDAQRGGRAVVAGAFHVFIEPGEFLPEHVFDRLLAGESGIRRLPESFNVMVKELQSLCLNIELLEQPQRGA